MLPEFSKFGNNGCHLLSVGKNLYWHVPGLGEKIFNRSAIVFVCSPYPIFIYWYCKVDYININSILLSQLHHLYYNYLSIWNNISWFSKNIIIFSYLNCIIFTIVVFLFGRKMILLFKILSYLNHFHCCYYPIWNFYLFIYFISSDLHHIYHHYLPVQRKHQLILNYKKYYLNFMVFAIIVYLFGRKISFSVIAPFSIFFLKMVSCYFKILWLVLSVFIFYHTRTHSFCLILFFRQIIAQTYHFLSFFLHLGGHPYHAQ